MMLDLELLIKMGALITKQENGKNISYLIDKLEIIKYFSNEGDLCCDNTCGRGTNLIASAYEGRKIIGFDLNKDNLDAIEDVVRKHTKLKEDDIKLHHSCGVEMVEYKDASNCIDLFINDIPFSKDISDNRINLVIAQ